MLVIYDPETMLPLYSVDEPYPAGSREFYTNRGMSWVEVPQGQIVNKRIVIERDSASLVDKLPLPASWNRTQINPNLNERAVLTVSVPVDIHVDNRFAVRVEDGIFEFEAETVGTFIVRAVAAPYESLEVSIRATVT